MTDRINATSASRSRTTSSGGMVGGVCGRCDGTFETLRSQRPPETLASLP